jgi:transcriptional regulator with AAA-type ATPase domain
MQSKIRDLINQKKYNDALNLISKELTKKFDLNNEHDEKYYTDLLALQTTARTLLGEYDNIVLDAVRKEKYPSEVRYNISDNKQIVLRFQNSFFLSCDAYINLIHVKKLFDISPQSAADAFVKRLGEKKIYDQIPKNKKYKLGDVIILKHDELATPLSFHLLAYSDDIKLDYDALTLGIKHVINKCIDMKLSNISCFALGYDVINSLPDGEKEEMAEELVDYVARDVLDAIQNIPEQKEFTVFFNFIKTASFDVYNRAFYRWTRKDPVFFQHTSKLGLIQKQFIDTVKTNNPGFLKTLQKLSLILDEPSSILFTGETGVGKSYLAKLTHQYSNKSIRPFESFNCALLKEDKNYTQLFGWIKGSFTDARDHGVGLIEKAENGTLFLDEIGYLGLEAQRGLLTFLDDGTYRRYGESKIRKANVRILFGTNQDLEDKVRQGSFTQDLYERIMMREFEIPSLRERKQDIKVFVDWLVMKLNHERKINIKIQKEAFEELEKFTWPGNVRQLQFYMQNLYNDCIYENKKVISGEMIKKNPPRNEIYTDSSNMTNLEKSLMYFIKMWNSENGKFMDDFIKPILAKIYKEDLNGNIKETDKFLGISGSSGKNSPFYKAYNKYQSIAAIYQQIEK